VSPRRAAIDPHGWHRAPDPHGVVCSVCGSVDAGPAAHRVATLAETQRHGLCWVVRETLPDGSVLRVRGCQ
jgi:hypothetical protein